MQARKQAKNKKPQRSPRPEVRKSLKSGARPGRKPALATRARRSGPDVGKRTRKQPEKGTDARFLRRFGKKLSPGILRAKWISSPGDHEDRPGQSLATRNHDAIIAWAEERRAIPCTVGQASGDGRARVLRFDFPGFGGKRLQPISWDQWFEPFDERDLVFLYQEHKRDGAQSNFFKLASPGRSARKTG